MDGAINLQATLSASSAGSEDPVVMPHHPITCSTTLRFHDDGSLECDHATAKPDDIRTQHCVNHTVALLLIELAVKWTHEETVVPAKSR